MSLMASTWVGDADISQHGLYYSSSMRTIIDCVCVLGVLLLIGCIVYGAIVDARWIQKQTGNNWVKLSYAFILTLVGGLMEIVAGILLIIEKIKGDLGGGKTAPSA
jgi:hypothetical protein